MQHIENHIFMFNQKILIVNILFINYLFFSLFFIVFKYNSTNLTVQFYTEMNWFMVRKSPQFIY